MSSKQDIIEKMMDRKRDILANLQKLKDEIITFDQEYDRSKQTHTIPAQVDNTQWIEKEKLLKEIDSLKIQNQVLMQTVQKGEVTDAENNLIKLQLTACRAELAQKNLELNESQRRNADLELTISDLKEELEKAKKLSPIPNTEQLIPKKIDNSDRIAMINQQQSLILEIERMKTEYEKYKDLIASIETVSSTGKICLVSSRGLKVTTMLELAQEIKNFK
jgi:hypothetical protein